MLIKIDRRWSERFSIFIFRFKCCMFLISGPFPIFTRKQACHQETAGQTIDDYYIVKFLWLQRNIYVVLLNPHQIVNNHRNVTKVCFEPPTPSLIGPEKLKLYQVRSWLVSSSICERGILSVACWGAARTILRPRRTEHWRTRKNKKYNYTLYHKEVVWRKCNLNAFSFDVEKVKHSWSDSSYLFPNMGTP